LKDAMRERGKRSTTVTLVSIESDRDPLISRPKNPGAFLMFVMQLPSRF